MIFTIIGFLLGVALCAWRPRFPVWVRGVAGKARDAVFGPRSAPAPKPIARGEKQPVEEALQSQLTGGGLCANCWIWGPRHAEGCYLAEVSPTSPKNPIDWGTAAKNIAGFFVGLIAWIAKNPIAAICLAVLVLWLVLGASCSPFALGKSKDALRLERELAEAEVRTQRQLNERDAAIAAIQRDTALLRQQIRTNAQRGRDAIAAATPDHEEPLDPGLVAAWRSGLDGLCVPRSNGDRLDTCRP